jgi:hypothetical protein
VAQSQSKVLLRNKPVLAAAMLGREAGLLPLTERHCAIAGRRRSESARWR